MNVSGDEEDEYKMSAHFRGFLAGYLTHLPALAQFLAPHHNSGKRFMEMYMSGMNIFWGFDNKDAALRVVSPTKKTRSGKPGVVTRAELKAFDHTSNMFYAFAAIIACGMDGMRRSIPLTKPLNYPPIEPFVDIPGIMDGVNMRPLPITIEERERYLLGNDEKEPDCGKPIRDLFGVPNVEDFIGAFKIDHAKYAAMSHEEEVNHMVERY